MNKRMFTFAIILLSFPIVFSAGNMTEFILPSCPEVWSCSEWAECDNGIQLRSCIDEDDCGTENFKPQIMRNCTGRAVMLSNATEQVQQSVSEEKLPEENASTNGMLLYAGLAAGIIIAGILLFFGYKKWSERRMISKMFETEKQTISQATASNLEQQPVQMQQQQLTTQQQDYSQQAQEASQQPAQVSAQSQANQQQPPDKIQAYIQQCISAGYTKDQIKAALLQAGWAQEAVDSALSKF